MTHMPATPINPAEEYPANQTGLAAADRDLYTARVRLRTEHDKGAQLDLYNRCAQLRHRIAEILNVVNGSYAQLPVKPTFTYKPVPENQDDDTRCCIECANSADGLLEVEHTASGVSTSVCLAHDGQQVRDMLATHARHQELQALAEQNPADSTADHADPATPCTLGHRALPDVIEEAGVLVLPEEDHCCTGAKIQSLADTGHVLLSLQVGGLTHAHQQPSEREEAAEMISKIRQALPAAHWNVVTPLPDGLIIALVKGTTH